ncbi:hypothetical protein P3T76_007862 [Phytophthora citrophthora]|uniref:Uncharacterized protein n=1 Tax=Phytophthora citrophthora TaxID=4793 RepID=A0AAD9GM11_9STRA|nr:hypothetical protein P3T76_007862 [Phytophthora citrophthora]
MSGDLHTPKSDSKREEKKKAVNPHPSTQIKCPRSEVQRERGYMQRAHAESAPATSPGRGYVWIPCHAECLEVIVCSDRVAFWWRAAGLASGYSRHKMADQLNTKRPNQGDVRENEGGRWSEWIPQCPALLAKCTRDCTEDRALRRPGGGLRAGRSESLAAAAVIEPVSELLSNR